VIAALALDEQVSELERRDHESDAEEQRDDGLDTDRGGGADDAAEQRGSWQKMKHDRAEQPVLLGTGPVPMPIVATPRNGRLTA
jgi:hypothetical protein